MTFEETSTNWESVINKINTYISSPRKEKLIDMYEKYADRICTAPASSHINRHRCEPGGYIDHVNRVIDVALTLYQSWKQLGANVSKFTEEELVFAALNHDLGKIGSSTDDYYVANDSKWHVEKGQIYKLNPVLQYMKVPDRSIFLLQEHGIQFTENEYLAIKLHDGLYSKGNESYYMAAVPELALKTDMPILLHHADHLATLIESNIQHSEPVKSTTATKSKMTSVNDPVVDQSLKSALDSLFAD